MKKLLLLFCLVFSLSPVWAQKINADSLVNVVIARNRNARFTAPKNLDSLIKAFPLTRDVALRSGLVVEILLDNYGINAKPMVDVANKLLLLTQKEKDEGGEAIATTIVGFTVYNSGDNARGLKEMLKGLKLAENKDDKEAIGVICNLLGVCTTNKTLSKLYYLKALQFSQAVGDKLFAGFELGNLYYPYRDEHKPDSALFYLLKSFELAVNNKLDMVTDVDLLNIGKLQSNPTVKLKYFRAALNMPGTKDNPELMERAAGAIASYYRESKQIDSALYYARKAFNVSNALLIGRKLLPAGMLATLYKGRNADSALKYTEISYALRDSMYNLDKIEHAHSLSLAEQQREEEIVAQKAAYQTNLRLYILAVVIAFLLLLAFVFWRNNGQNKKAKIQIQNTLDELKLTQQQLIQSEKMASLGELTAGIAHEIQNPLNFVNNFSEVNTELIDEIEIEIEKGNLAEIKAIASNIKQNEQKISMHGKRADAIVKGMLQHSQVSGNTKALTDINKLADEYLGLAYHGFRAKDKAFNADLVTGFDEKLPLVNLVPQDIGRVMLNLFNNAFYAVQKKQVTAGPDYKPTVEITTELDTSPPAGPKDSYGSGGKGVVIKVKDNGSGIPEKIKDKIMQPFFTTKPTGEGTGLGLSLSYDIVVKGHGGSITVDTEEGEFTAFIVSLPVM